MLMKNHWGWYWKVKKKHKRKQLCSSLTALDSFHIYKNTKPITFQLQPLEVYGQSTPDSVVMTFRRQKNKPYSIKVDKVARNFGGFVHYFLCPLCQRRMRFLYFAEQSIFLCRKCLNLGYESQRLRPTLRYARMSDKIKTLIKNKGGDFVTHEKPPRMHKNTHQRLRSKQRYYESKSAQASNAELRLWFGAKAEAYLDEFFDYVDESRDWQRK